ncbi:class I tRNA ligase family protein [Collimonas pratensis]|uniref:Methionyl-tRNA synthetase n=1 Tax=Collimonas pratensis TaxID=279113 RepID=A0A127PY26_9BURK|nr:class I tRNA ligase family protein [Collimonas pratensis]AMP02687.1 tRNA synthetases class I family protein [Collimonas pratensis]
MNQALQTFFVCPAPPCPNGKLHLGHIGGVYLLADIFVRYQRLRGNAAHYVTGADEHGSYTLVKAGQLGRPVDEVSAMYSGQILHCLEAMGIEVDEFVKTTSQDHKQHSLSVFDELSAAGLIEIEDGRQLYCESCQEFAADSLARGFCPECGEPTDSNLCEGCGHGIQHATLRQAQHVPCGQPLSLRPIRQAHLKLEPIADRLIPAIEASAWPRAIKDKETRWLKEELRNLAMSRNFARGVTLAQPAEVAGQTLLTWFEGLWCFDTGIKRICERNKADYSETMRSPDSKIVFFMGQDNRFYYTIGVTASLLGRGYAIPHNQAIQDFSKLEGEKFSTSRNHALWADEVARDVDQSVLRYYLAGIAKPFGQNDNDFQVDGLIQAALRVREYETALRKHVGGSRSYAFNPLLPVLADAVAQYQAAMDAISFWDALHAIDTFFAHARFADATASQLDAQEISLFLSMLHPIIPVLVKSYGACFFGAQWQPSLSLAGESLHAGSPPVKIDFPLFGQPIQEKFVAAYIERFKAPALAD